MAGYLFLSEKPGRTADEEKILYLFSIGGLIADTFFVCCLTY